MRHDYELLVKMYNFCDKIAGDNYGHHTTREDEIEGVKAAMRKIEREIVVFHLANPERITLPRLQREESPAPIKPTESAEKAA